MSKKQCNETRKLQWLTHAVTYAMKDGRTEGRQKDRRTEPGAQPSLRNKAKEETLHTLEFVQIVIFT